MLRVRLANHCVEHLTFRFRTVLAILLFQRDFRLQICHLLRLLLCLKFSLRHLPIDERLLQDVQGLTAVFLQRREIALESIVLAVPATRFLRFGRFYCSRRGVSSEAVGSRLIFKNLVAILSNRGFVGIDFAAKLGGFLLPSLILPHSIAAAAFGNDFCKKTVARAYSLHFLPGFSKLQSVGF